VKNLAKYFLMKWNRITFEPMAWSVQILLELYPDVQGYILYIPTLIASQMPWMMILANDRLPLFITPPLRKTWPILIRISSHLLMVIQAPAGEPRPLINMKEITGPSTSRTGHGVRTRQYNFPVTVDIVRVNVGASSNWLCRTTRKESRLSQMLGGTSSIVMGYFGQSMSSPRFIIIHLYIQARIHLLHLSTT
jgi:hypothetical protein